MIIGGSILLGLIASVFLIFSSSVQLVRVGLVAALWAAVIGAVAVTRYRRESAAGRAKVQELQAIHKLQLEREMSARREFELAAEARIRAEVGADAGEMAALRAELTVLRESLQRLFDGNLAADRPALRADAIRLQELPSADAEPENPANDNPEETGTWDAWSSPVTRYPVTPVFEPDHLEPPAFASPFDEPVTAETQVVTSEDLEAVAEADADAQHDTEILKVDSAVSAPHAHGATLHAATNAPREPATAPREPAASVSAGARRRRRAESGDDYPGRKLSVAEIMANLKSEQSAR